MKASKWIGAGVDGLKALFSFEQNNSQSIMKAVGWMKKKLSNTNHSDGADPIDAEIGKKIRYRRWFLGMSQAELGKLVGVQFQQIQKYENAANRVSASRLWKLSQALGVDISFFFPPSLTNQERHIGSDANTEKWTLKNVTEPQKRYAQR